jgi:hypothetical protein
METESSPKFKLVVTININKTQTPQLMNFEATQIFFQVLSFHISSCHNMVNTLGVLNQNTKQSPKHDHYKFQTSNKKNAGINNAKIAYLFLHLQLWIKR